ncbi:BAX inhibitor (BI)-1/YccA family protein [Escherichia coli]|nr:BAX inhibitor (BI)-1/YccA family protein [Escherichia coli]
MESYSKNSNKLDFQHEARILNGIWLITALGLVATAGLAWGAKYLEITATKYDSLPMYVAIGLLLLCMYGLSKDINKINAAIAGVIYLFLLSLVAIVVASLVPVYAIIIVNAALMSERPIWVISCLMIVLWSGIISHGRNKLLELAGKCHSEELWSPVRCAFIGALTLYYYFIGFFGILAAIAITLVWQRHTRFFH